MDQPEINKILSELESGYDRMADKFSSTRKYFWRDLAFITDLIDHGDKVLDFGCGNGRLLEILKNKKIEYRGADISGKLLDKAKEKYPENKDNFIKLSGSDILPFPADYFNKIISIAVFHHFPDAYAEKMAKELFRILKTSGTAVITVWDVHHEKGEKEIYVPFKDNGAVDSFDRYHRIYSEEELKKIFTGAGFTISKTSNIPGKNTILIADKN